MTGSEHEGIARAIRWLAHHHAAQPSIGDAARIAGLSPAHFSRAFHRRVGVSPKVFLKHLTLEDLKSRLASGTDFLTATLGAGLSGPSRVHDHFVTLDAVSPGEYRRAGAGLKIRYGFTETALGAALIATTTRGVCFLAFTTDPASRQRAVEELQATWPRATLVESEAEAAAAAASLRPGPKRPLTLCVRGTNFQVQVWRALLRIPEGTLTSYAALAEAIGRPTAHRAVANAVGANPVSWLIPCHRVIRTSGALGGYRWGLDAKRTLLALESC